MRKYNKFTSHDEIVFCRASVFMKTTNKSFKSIKARIIRRKSFNRVEVHNPRNYQYILYPTDKIK
jgi:hypothetical protein